jgi:hypothetical protein
MVCSFPGRVGKSPLENRIDEIRPCIDAQDCLKRF